MSAASFGAKHSNNKQLKNQYCLPGQAVSLQLCVSTRSSFEQPLSHVRVLVCSPDPHVKLQDDQSLHIEKPVKTFLLSGHSPPYLTCQLFQIVI